MFETVLVSGYGFCGKTEFVLIHISLAVERDSYHVLLQITDQRSVLHAQEEAALPS